MSQKEESLKNKVSKVKKVRMADELKGKTEPAVLVERFRIRKIGVSLRELIGVSPSIHKTFFTPFEPSMRVTAQFAQGDLPNAW